MVSSGTTSVDLPNRRLRLDPRGGFRIPGRLRLPRASKGSPPTHNVKGGALQHL